ncbi:MAG: hypothetical protein ACI80V_003589 [Rhodothermales bacterium]|jgi:hypothetical protein
MSVMTPIRTLSLGFVLALAFMLTPLMRRSAPVEGGDAPGPNLAAERLALAERGEFGLFLDFEAGTAELVYGAVVLRRIPIASARRRAPGRIHVGSLESRRGLLPYQPVQLVVASADSSLAKPPTKKPLDADPAYGILTLDSGIDLILNPSDISGFGALRIKAYRVVDHGVRAVKMAAIALTGSAPTESRLKVDMADADARAIFRALPEGARVVMWP